MSLILRVFYFLRDIVLYELLRVNGQIFQVTRDTLIKEDNILIMTLNVICKIFRSCRQIAMI